MSQATPISDAATTLQGELRAHDRARYLSSLNAPNALRSGLWGLLALGRELDRIPQSVSEPMLGRIKLQWWVDVVPGIIGGRPPSHPAARALAEHAEALKPHLDALRDWIRAREVALEALAGADLAGLERYAHTTGGAMHVLMLAVLGVEEAAATEAASHVGAAWVLLDLAEREPERRRDLADLAQENLRQARAMAADVPVAALPALLSAQLLDGRIRCLQSDQEIPPAGFGAYLSILWCGALGKY